MRTSMAVLTVICVVIIVVGATGTAHAQCIPETELTDYLTRHYPNKEKQILAFDHKTRTWAGYRWKNNDLDPEPSSFEDLALAKPRVLINSDLLVVVTNTNPLLYAATQSEATRVDSADLASLRDLALLIGGVATVATEIAGQRDALGQLQAAAAARVQPQRAADAQLMGELMAKPITPTDLDELAALFVTALDAETATVDTPLAELTAAANGLKALLTKATVRGESLSALIQIVEVGQAPIALLPVTPADLQLPHELEKGFVNLAAARAAMQTVKPLCADEAAAAITAIGHKRFGYPADARLRAAAEKEFAEALKALTGAGGLTCDGDSRDVLRLLGRWLESSPPANSPAPDAQQIALEQIEDAASKYVTVIAKSAATVKGAGETLQNRFKPVQTAARVVAISQLQNKYFDGNTDYCSLITGVIEVDRSIRSENKLPFGKEGDEKFVISPNPSFADIEKYHPAPVTAPFLVAKKRLLDFDIDVALVYTKLSNPTFTAVEVPVPDTNPQQKKIFIRRTNESTRAGDLAALLTIKGPGPYWWLHPQIGAGVQSDTPALFAGVAAPIGPYFKLSGGWTWQKVTRLANGLIEDQEIAAAGDLKTRDGFARKWYASLSITLDNVPFFKKP